MDGSCQDCCCTGVDSGLSGYTRPESKSSADSPGSKGIMFPAGRGTTEEAKSASPGSCGTVFSPVGADGGGAAAADAGAGWLVPGTAAGQLAGRCSCKTCRTVFGRARLGLGLAAPGLGCAPRLGGTAGAGAVGAGMAAGALLLSVTTGTIDTITGLAVSVLTVFGTTVSILTVFDTTVLPVSVCAVGAGVALGVSAAPGAALGTVVGPGALAMAGALLLLWASGVSGARSASAMRMAVGSPVAVAHGVPGSSRHGVASGSALQQTGDSQCGRRERNGPGVPRRPVPPPPSLKAL